MLVSRIGLVIEVDLGWATAQEEQIASAVATCLAAVEEIEMPSAEDQGDQRDTTGRVRAPALIGVRPA